MELDGTLTLTAAHDIADRVERRLRDAFANTDVLVHQEPAGLADERLDHRIR
ncbi:cation transporter dimerization domain-containing protein [Azospirillum doebereinerae]|uniref:cation transporter dimerization domain-containing protein n=1 Tax=Azospirillum doebereinerae TaxID=92933 RepID=UPI003850B499